MPQPEENTEGADYLSCPSALEDNWPVPTGPEGRRDSKKDIARSNRARLRADNRLHGAIYARTSPALGPLRAPGRRATRDEPRH